MMKQSWLITVLERRNYQKVITHPGLPPCFHVLAVSGSRSKEKKNTRTTAGVCLCVWMKHGVAQRYHPPSTHTHTIQTTSHLSVSSRHQSTKSSSRYGERLQNFGNPSFWNTRISLDHRASCRGNAAQTHTTECKPRKQSVFRQVFSLTYFIIMSW